MLLGWALIQSDYCPYKKREAEKEVQMRTQVGDNHLHTQKKDLRRNQP